PDQPYSPKWPRFLGINGCQFASMCDQLADAKIVARPMKIRTTETLIITAALLKLADSRTPITKMAVTITMAAKAMMSILVCMAKPKSENETAGVRLNGSFAPKKLSKLLT